MGHRGPFVVGEEHQDLHLLAAIGHQAVIGRIGARALAQAAGRTGYSRPARVAFVVAGDHGLAHAGHALHRLHTGHAAHLEVKSFHRTHHCWRQAGLLDTLGLGKNRQHIKADGVAADDFSVVLVVA
ncbi:hypothetical protein D3C85_1540380 [compost metagenome]